MSTRAIASVVPPSVRGHTVRPWFLAPFEALPLPITWAVAGFSVLFFGVALLLRPEQPIPASVTFNFERLAAVISVLIGYSIATASIAIRAAVRDLEELRPQLDCSGEEFGLLVRSVIRQTVRSTVAAVLVGVAVALVLMRYNMSISGVHTGLPGFWPWFQLMLPLALLQWVVTISAVWVLVSIALVFRRVGTHLPRVDLFGLEGLAPFQRVGLRMALILFGLFAIRFLLALRPENVGYLVITTGTMVALGTLAVLLPLWGVHVRIAAEKRRELAAIRDALRGEPTRSSDGSVQVSRELLDLLEYRKHVESVGEWLFDAPAFLRFLLYLGIPVLGWVGGAVVERLFDSVVRSS